MSAVDHRGGGHVVAEDLAPRGERLVRGDDHRRALVAAGDEHEHQARGLGVERDVAHLVAGPAAGYPFQAVECFVELALALRVGEERDPLGRGGGTGTRWPARHAQSPRAILKMCLAGPSNWGVMVHLLVQVGLARSRQDTYCAYRPRGPRVPRRPARPVPHRDRVGRAPSQRAAPGRKTTKHSTAWNGSRCWSATRWATSRSTPKPRA